MSTQPDFDPGTASLSRHFEMTVETEPATGRRRARVSNQTVLEGYFRRGQLGGKGGIARRRYNAGERLRRDFEVAGLAPQLTADMTREVRATSPDPFPERRLAALKRYRKAFAAVGPLAAPILEHVCCQDEKAGDFIAAAGYGKGRSAEILGMGLVRMALDALADHLEGRSLARMDKKD